MKKYFNEIFIAVIVLGAAFNAGYTAEQVGAKTFFNWAFLYGFEAVSLLIVFAIIRIYSEARQWFWLALILSLATRIGIGMVIYHQFEGKTGNYAFWQHEVFSFIIASAELLASLLSASTEVQLRELLTAETQNLRNAEARNAELAHELEVRNRRIDTSETYYKHLNDRYKFLLLHCGIQETEFQKLYAKSGNLLPPIPETQPSVTINVTATASAETVQSATQQQVTVLQNSGSAEIEAAEVLNFRKAEAVQQQVVAYEVRKTESRIAENGSTESGTTELLNTENGIAEVLKAEVRNGGTAEMRNTEVQNAESGKSETLNAEVRNRGIADVRELETHNAAARLRLGAERENEFTMQRTSTTTTTTTTTQEQVKLTAKELYRKTYLNLPSAELQKLVALGMTNAVKGKPFTQQQLFDFARNKPDHEKEYLLAVANTKAYHEVRLDA